MSKLRQNKNYKNNIMGNCKQYKSQTNYETEEWSEIQRKKDCFLLKHRYHNIPNVQRWISCCQQNKDIYEWRKMQTSPFFIKLLQFGQINKKYEQNNCYVITEELIELEQLIISKKEAVNLAQGYIRGFASLVDRFGLFDIGYGMMLINRKGNPKVWINHNLAVNTPQFIDSKITERDFISKFRMLINKRIQNNNEHLCFNKYTFKQVIDELTIAKRKSYELNLEIQLNGYEIKWKQGEFQDVYNRKYTKQSGINTKQSKINNKQSELKQSAEEQFPHKLRFMTEEDLERMNIWTPIRDYSPINNKNISDILEQKNNQRSQIENNNKYQITNQTVQMKDTHRIPNNQNNISTMIGFNQLLSFHSDFNSPNLLHHHIKDINVKVVQSQLIYIQQSQK